MTWPVPADPNQFEEALRFFSSRVIMSADFAAELDAKARTEAFWIGTGLHVERIQSVFQEIEKAIANGESFEDFRKRVKEQLENRAHAETVFRNATQRAYNAGRYSQMRDPAVMAARPFWMFDAILDSATTEICKDANGTVLPANHQWWDSNVPPRHHRCRSSIRNLRRKEAERRGISDDGPTDAEPGFGAAPSDADVEKLKPKVDTDPAIVGTVQKKRRQPRKRKPKPAKAIPGKAKKPPKKPPVGRKKLQTPPEHYDPDYWASQYRDKYGNAAVSVGWGRAMQERVLDRPLSEIIDQVTVLEQAGHPAFQPFWANSLRNQLGRLDASSTLRGTVEFDTDPLLRNLVLQLEHSFHVRGKGVTLNLIPGESAGLEEFARLTNGFYSTMLDRSVVRRPLKVRWVRVATEENRSYYASDTVVIRTTAQYDTMVHEVAHALEDSDRRALDRSFDFFEARTRGEDEVVLLDYYKARGIETSYAPYERAKPDKFDDPYQGKVYRAGDKRRATEMTAMGYQNLSKVEGEDPESLWFMLGQLAGR